MTHPTSQPSDTTARLLAALTDAIGTADVEHHFTGVRFERVSERQVIVAAPDEMAELILERNHRALIERTAAHVWGQPIEVTFRRISMPQTHAIQASAPREAALTASPSAATVQVSLFELAEPVATHPDSAGPLERWQQSVQGAAPAAPTPAAAAPAVYTLAAAPVHHIAPAAAPAPAPVHNISTYAERVRECGLNAQNSFDSFVVGDGSELAYTAALTAAEAPGQIYNPLFIYGGVGLGKTHLMNAIGLVALQRDPTLRVRYVSAEAYANDFIDAIRTKTMDVFRQQHRTDVDMLLIDDIQFIEDKERTGAEFFHTFNTLHQAGCQIVMTSDRTPQEMPKLEARLQSRLNMGLLADVQAPDLETRIAILKRFTMTSGFHMDDDVLEFIARSVRSNVRALCGALLRIGTAAKVRNMPVTLEFARVQLDNVLSESRARPSVDLIVRLSADAAGVKVSDIVGKRRIARIALARKVAMYVAREHNQGSFPELGRAFQRDHSTVVHAHGTVSQALPTNDELRRLVEAVERKLNLA